MYRFEVPQRRGAYSMIAVCIRKLMFITMINDTMLGMLWWWTYPRYQHQLRVWLARPWYQPQHALGTVIMYGALGTVIMYGSLGTVILYGSWMLQGKPFFPSFLLVFLNKISCPTLSDVCAKKKFPSPFFCPRFTNISRYVRLLWKMTSYLFCLKTKWISLLVNHTIWSPVRWQKTPWGKYAGRHGENSPRFQSHLWLGLGRGCVCIARVVPASLNSFSASFSEFGQSPPSDLGRFGVWDQARASKSKLVCLARCLDLVSCLPLSTKACFFSWWALSSVCLLGLIDEAWGGGSGVEPSFADCDVWESDPSAMEISVWESSHSSSSSSVTVFAAASAAGGGGGGGLCGTFPGVL